MTVTTLQTILITALIATWLVFSIVFLISSIQSFFNDRKREKREEESAARDLKYHEERMKREKEQAEHEREAFKKYNIRDVETEIGIKDRLAKFPVPEAVWDEYHIDGMNTTSIRKSTTVVSGSIWIW